MNTTFTVSSKSTDKLKLIIDYLSTIKIEDIQSVEIDWKSLDDALLPKLILKLK